MCGLFRGHSTLYKFSNVSALVYTLYKSQHGQKFQEFVPDTKSRPAMQCPRISKSEMMDDIALASSR